MPSTAASSSQSTALPVGLVSELTAKYGEAQRGRLESGCAQVVRLWRAEDGDAEALASFVREHFAGTTDVRDALFARFERIFEQIDGHMVEIAHALMCELHLDRGPLLPVDSLFAGYEPWAHLTADLFENKIAFVALLNFPLTTLDERLTSGPSWTRREWAEARLALRFAKRVPADVNLAAARKLAEAERYTSGYNIWMHHVVDAAGRRLFPAKKRLISHWGLRDELKAAYADRADGLAKQRLIAHVMDRIVTQTIPAAVIDNPGVDWEPVANRVTVAAVMDAPDAVATRRASTDEREPDTRYATLLSSFQAAQLIDPYSPTAPTLIQRRFEENREISEPRVRAMLEQVLGSPLVPRVAALIERRLGRSLEPFDIWYNGFRTEGTIAPAELDPIVAGKYPTAVALEQDLPHLLQVLGFSPDRASYLAQHIAVDASRGAGHAAGAAMRGAKARLRTRISAAGMDYQGFNIAAHELGHNVEQVFSINDVDHALLAGVPNSAFTEAIAFVFQARDLALLGHAPPPDARREAASTLDDFWGLFEISGVALADMEIWHWMYAHPAATPAQLRGAVLDIAREIWNRYYAPHFRSRDVPLLAIYTHLLSLQMYTPDYAIGSLIAFQIEDHLRGKTAIGPEIERMVRYGSVAPDLWMNHATGAPVGAESILTATARALDALAD